MIFDKLWSALSAQLNKIANFFWEFDPIAQLQYEYDDLIDQLKDGRVGLEKYRALVERVERQVAKNRARVSTLQAKVRVYLQAGNRETAGMAALELRSAQREMAENEGQLRLHEQVYENQLLRIKHASNKLGQLRGKIRKYDADLRMSRAEAELAKIAASMRVDVTTDFGRAEQDIQNEIDRNRAKARVASDLSAEGLDEVRREIAVDKQLAEDALRQYEREQDETEPERETTAAKTRVMQ
jgi:phage shock protein A